MRLLGLHTANKGVPRACLERILCETAGAPGTLVHWLPAAGHKAQVAVAAIKGGNPEVQWASRQDGSFTVLDGDVFSGWDVAQGDKRPVHDVADRVLDSYFAKGVDALEALNAAASITIWDAATRRLIIARDRVGVVPIYYANVPSGLAWSSDQPSLLATGAARDIDPDATDFFLANGFLPAPWTLIKSVRKIPPGHVLICGADGNVSVRPYYLMTGQPKTNQSREEKAASIAEAFEKSLRQRCARNGPTGVLLSSGIDSTLLVAGLRKLIGAEVKTFTIGYSDSDGAQDESPGAQRSAELLGAEHHEITMTPGDLRDNFTWMLRNYGEPFIWGLRAFPLGLVREAGLDSVLTGDGADSWFMSKADRAAAKLSAVPDFVLGEMKTAAPLMGRFDRQKGLRMSSLLWCAQTGFPARCSGRIVPIDRRRALYRDPSWLPEATRAAHELLAAAAADYQGESRRDTTLFMHRRFFGAENSIHFNHWWARAHNIPLRLPYHDVDLLGRIYRLPKRSTNKAEVRELAAALMPTELVNRPKLVTSFPLGIWLRGPLRDFLHDQLAPSRLARHGLFDSQVVQKLVERHVSGRANLEIALWAILSLVAWQDVVLQGPTGAILADRPRA